MLVPSTGRRRLSAAFAAAPRSPSPCSSTPARPAPPSARAVRRPRRARRCRLLRRRRRAAAPARPALGRAAPPLRAGPGRRGDLRQRRAAARALRRRAARPSRARARRRPGARARALPHRPAVWAERPPAGADPQVTGPGWMSGPGRPNRHPVFDTAVVDGLVHAYLARDGARPRPRHGRAHPRRDPPRRHEPRLPLAGAAAQPVQLVLRDVRRRRDRQRRRAGAGRRARPQLARFLAGGRRGTRRSATSGPGCASTTCRTRGRARARTSTRPSTRTSC